MLRSLSIALTLTLLALPGMAQESTPEPPAETPETLPPLDQRSELDASNLARQLSAAEQQLLQVGDETVLALWRPANTGEAKGMIILLPDAGESADWPLVISPLRQRLPDAGWHSLSLTLPDLPELPLAKATESVSADAQVTDNASDAASTVANPDSASDPTPVQDETAAPSAEELTQAFQEQVNARLQAALAFAKTQKATEVVLLGHGQGARWAMVFLTEQKPPEVTRLLLIAPDLNEPMEEELSALALPIGDFYYKEQSTDREQALRRLNSSKRNKQKGYSQVGLKALPGNRAIEQEQLYRRVRGWLDKGAIPPPRKEN